MITVVIPVYNRESTLPSTLASIDAQTRRPDRVILVDNASTDSSLSIITEWASTRPYVTVVSESRPGAAAARNRGLREVATEWTMFFDSDDLMHPNHVADFADGIAAHPDCDLLGRDIYVELPDRGTVMGYFMARVSPMLWNLWRGSLATQRYIARTELFRSVGGWDETDFGWDDIELGVRLIIAGARMAKLPGSPSVTTRYQEQSITGTLKSNHPERWEHTLETIRSRVEALPPGHSSRRRWLFLVDLRSILLAAIYRREAAVADTCVERERREALANALYKKVRGVTDYPLTVGFIYRYFDRIVHVSRPMLRLFRHIF